MCPLSRTSGLLGLFFDRGVTFSWQNACFVAHLGRFLAVFDRGADSWLKEQANAFPARDPQPTEPFV